MGNRDVVYVHNNIGRTIWAKSRKWASSHNMRDFRDVAAPHDWDVATPHFGPWRRHMRHTVRSRTLSVLRSPSLSQDQPVADPVRISATVFRGGA